MVHFASRNETLTTESRCSNRYICAGLNIATDICAIFRYICFVRFWSDLLSLMMFKKWSEHSYRFQFSCFTTLWVAGIYTHTFDWWAYWRKIIGNSLKWNVHGLVQVLVFSWSDENIVSEVRTEHLPNAILELNRYTNLFCKWVNCKEKNIFRLNTFMISIWVRMFPYS
jgi:hypothetical protein